VSALHWREGEYRDRKELQDFLCSPPAKARRFGRGAPPQPVRWELEAQGGVRNLRPPAPADQLILIGEDKQRRIGAVGHVVNDHGPGLVFVRVLAVSLELRNQGPGPDGLTVGDELMTELVDRLANRADAAGEPYLVMWAKIDSRNEPCRAMCRRAGADSLNRDGNLEEWVLRVDFS
jgi:hypothetical protein